MGDGRYQGCIYSEHRRCGSCKGVVLRNSNHAHTFIPSHKSHNVLCGECYYIVITAAEVVMRAVQHTEIDVTGDGLQRAISLGQLQVFVQEAFTSAN
jgi:hypothetical protein